MFSVSFGIYFIYIRTIFCRLPFIISIPLCTRISSLKKFFAPAIKYYQLKILNTFSLHAKRVVDAVIIRSKCIGYENTLRRNYFGIIAYTPYVVLAFLITGNTVFLIIQDILCLCSGIEDQPQEGDQ